MSATIFGPKVITGTKWPSITSMWITRAPASITSRTCSRMRPKSAERIDGATSIVAGHSRMPRRIVNGGRRGAPLLVKRPGSLPITRRRAHEGSG